MFPDSRERAPPRQVEYPFFALAAILKGKFLLLT